jgi:hypothetical protein
MLVHHLRLSWLLFLAAWLLLIAGVMNHSIAQARTGATLAGFMAVFLFLRGCCRLFRRVALVQSCGRGKGPR